MKDDAKHIASHLVEEHGLEGAIRAAMEGTIEAQKERDNYALSVWREVKRILRDQKD